jgi:hypothetical protein
MYDSDYDRQIIKQVTDINRRFIAHQRAVGRARMMNGYAETGAGLAGGSFLDSIPGVGSIASMFGLGDTGAGLAGGSFLDNIPVVGNIASMFGLGETGRGKKKRVYKKKGGALLNMVEKNGGNLGMSNYFGLGETGAGRKKLGRAITGSADTGAGRKKRVYKKKGGADSGEYGTPLTTAPVLSTYEKFKPVKRATVGREGVAPPVLRAAKKASGLAGGSFLDNIPVVGSLAHMFGLGETGAGKKKRVSKKKGKGVEDALEGMGSKAGAKKNPWVAHVKAVAAKKGITYREALKVAKASYK